MQPRHADELQELLSVQLDDAERQSLAHLAREAGCAASLASVLPHLGVNVTNTVDGHSTAVIRWKQRVASGSHGAYFWIEAFRRGDLRERWAVARHAVWPSREDLLLAHPDVNDTVGGLLRARIARCGRGIRSLPTALRAIRRPR